MPGQLSLHPVSLICGPPGPHKHKHPTFWFKGQRQKGLKKSCFVGCFCLCAASGPYDLVWDTEWIHMNPNYKQDGKPSEVLCASKYLLGLRMPLPEAAGWGSSEDTGNHFPPSSASRRAT